MKHTPSHASERVASAEHRRLAERGSGAIHPWRKWGPYVSERAWGTVREDYSAYGTAWDYFPHDLARSKAYRWGEDAIAGLCDRYQLLVFGLALWNGKDPILKERMFGLTNPEGNHGEDPKEYWFYLDNTPTHSYMRMLYKYPQREFPYEDLVRENARYDRVFEYELLDTGVFNENRYFDVFVEFAKFSPEDIAIRIEAINRGPDPAPLHLIPQLWFRNTWSWTRVPQHPAITHTGIVNGVAFTADDANAPPLQNLQSPYCLGRRFLYAESAGEVLYTDNESNPDRVPDAPRADFCKDAFHRYIINGERCVKPEPSGTKACVHDVRSVAPSSSTVLRLRLSDRELDEPFAAIDDLIHQRKREADEFYSGIHPPHASEEERDIQRQAFAGMLWNKQIYLFDVNRWLEGDGTDHVPPSHASVRNTRWRHLNSMRILPVPDCWEYPWFAAWDLAFQCVTLALVDLEFAKENLWVLLFEQFQHPNGQIPAYEWEFSDLNPPVHAWACWRVYNIERQRTGRRDLHFLEKCFHKLLINFAWWVNRADRDGNNVFEGGFLGLDNITVVDRSAPLPGGAFLEQSDGTGWMGFFCLNLMRIALELARDNPAYEVLATKFFQHFIYIGAAMKKMGGRDYQLWDERDGFFYDVLRYPNGEFHKFRLRSLVGLIPLFAIEVLNRSELTVNETFLGDLDWFLENRRDIVGEACFTVGTGDDRRYVLSVVNPQQFSRILERLADPSEFLSPYGFRSLSKYHEQNPYTFGDVVLKYEPAESGAHVKGGNSNWRGPVWFPTSYLLIESLLRFGAALRPDFSVEVPGQQKRVSPYALANDVAERLISIFKRDAHGCRPCYGGTQVCQYDPAWRDYLLFFEYFHGDNGAGLGAMHQTGWTGLVANLIDEWRR